ncbi:NAD(P)/FAD-dependent oxidoreductase [Nocardioides ginsengisoli]|uniref:NAD(P)/FAD-dependent oxidoreductase n=1 Tax=Nocardioides ginsengisoli TaxID=363868 RepID=A0ABW3W8J0_9ACTN
MSIDEKIAPQTAFRGGRRIDPEYDVVVVGARCAGAPLATLLARAGLSVVLLEQARFPRDTMSTHIMEANVLAFLDRLGVTAQVRATGAPYVMRSNVRIDDLQTRQRIPQIDGDVGGAASVRRFVLDPILVGAAADAGVDVRMGARVTGLLRNGDRVSGVRVGQDGTSYDVAARLVVGADGRGSTVAELVGSRRYNVAASERLGYWGFYENADSGPDPELIFHKWDDRLVVAMPADAGLYQVVEMPVAAERDAFRADLRGAFDAYARSCGPVARVLTGATLTGKVQGMVRWEGFFREPSGPGWVLVGDAGHFKDPAPGQGIGDAFRQAEMLAPEIVAGLAAHDVDERIRVWGVWRDRDATPMYWTAVDFGKAGPSPLVVAEVARRMVAKGTYDRMLDMFNHRSDPWRVFTPAVATSATLRMLVRPGAPRRRLLREYRDLAVADARRKRQLKRPVYAPSPGPPSRP